MRWWVVFAILAAGAVITTARRRSAGRVETTPVNPDARVRISPLTDAGGFFPEKKTLL